MSKPKKPFTVENLKQELNRQSLKSGSLKDESQGLRLIKPQDKIIAIIKPTALKQFQVAEILSQFETYGALLLQAATHNFKDRDVYETYELFGSYPDAKELYSYLCGTSLVVVFEYNDPIQLARDLAIERSYPVKVITRNVDRIVSFWFGR